MIAHEETKAHLEEKNAVLQTDVDTIETNYNDLRERFHAEKAAHEETKEKLKRVYATIGKAGGVLNNESE